MNDGNVDSTFVLKFGEYRLVEELGESAQFRVFKARHGKLQRDVVIKLLRDEFAADREALARFRREMEAVGGVEHPHVVWATDAGEHEGTPYIVMEYLAGQTLQQIVAVNGPLRTADACELARQAAEGLACIHDRSMVHRDVKPSNLLLTSDGIVKLLDFGLVRMTEGSTSGEELTATASALGTADYMAPEQATDSRSVDFRADIYSLGCTLYELLTGAAPFSNIEHDTAVKKLLAHRQAPAPPVQATRRDVPDELAHLLQRMLAKAPGDRPRSIADVMGALKNFTDGHALQRLVGVTEAAGAARGMRPLQPGLAPSASEKSNRGTPITVGRPSRRLLSVGVLTLLAIPVVIYVGWRAWHATPEPAVVQNGAPSDVETPAGNGAGTADSESSIPTGTPSPPPPLPTPPPTPEQELAELRQAVDGATSGQSTGDQAELRQRVAALARRSAGTSRQLAAAELLARLASPADTRQQASIPAEELASAGPKPDQPPPEGLVAVFGSSRLRHWLNARAIAFSPDGTLLATPGSDGVIRVWDARTGEPIERLQFGAAPFEAVGFTSDGSSLLAMGSGGRFLIWNAVTWESPRSAQPQGGTIAGRWDSAWVVFSPDASILVAAGQGHAVLVYEPHSGQLRHTLTGHSEFVKCVAVSGDSRSIVSGDEAGEVIVWDAVSGELLQRVKPGHGPVWSVALNSDGTIAAAGHADGAITFIEVGAPSEQRTVNVPGAAGSLSFSPDGRKLLVGSGGPGTGVRELAVDSGATLRVLDPSSSWSHFPRYSPDGSTIACGYWEGDVGLWDATTGERRFASPSHANAVWSVAASADGSLLAAGGRDGNVVVWNVETGELVRKMNFGAWPKVLAFQGEPEQLYVALNHGGNGTRTVGWWDVATWRRQRTLQVPGETWSLPGTVPAADGSFVVSVDEQNDISIWESGGRERVILPNHGAAVDVMAVSANGKWVASAEHNERVRIWDAESGEELRTLITPGVFGTALAFSPDGRWLACGASDCAIRMWNTETWDEPALLTGHELTRFGITGLAFSPNGAWISSCSGDGSVRVWDAESHKLHSAIAIGPARGLVNALTFFPDSRHLVTGNQNGTVSLLRLKTE